MESKIPPLSVEQEPPEDKEMSETTESSQKTVPEASGEICNVKTTESSNKLRSAKKRVDAKRVKKEPQACAAKEGRGQKTSAPEMEGCLEPPRAGVFPYRTKSDFCCTICNAHMNSIQMWESHIRGKRHLKNCKKETVVGASVSSLPMPVKKEKVDDVAGLYYIDTQGAQSPPHGSVLYERRPESPGDSRSKEYPSVESSSSITAAISSVETPPAFVAGTTSNIDIRNFSDLNITMTERIDYIRELLYRDDILAPYIMPYAAANGSSFILVDGNTRGMLAGHHIKLQCPANTSDLIQSLLNQTIINRKSTSIFPQNESDVNEIKSILAALGQSIMQYEIRQLPFAAQQKLAKELFRGN